MDKLRKYTKGSATFTAISGLVILVLVCYLFFLLGTSGKRISPEDASEASTNNRILPLGVVKVSDGVAPGSRTGKQIYEKICIQCHGPNSSVAAAPKFGNKAMWAPRIAEGYDTLKQHAIHGYKGMPARGGASDLTDDEVARAVAYMANDAGANFTPPPVQ